jgi:hypothetical protein
LTWLRSGSNDGAVRRSLAIVLVALVCGALAAVAAPLPAGAAPRSAVIAAQDPDAPADDGTGGSDEDPDENPQPGAPDRDIIPRPNSGQEPTEAGERGGVLQIVVFVALVAGVGTIVVLATRDVRRSRSGARRAGTSS